MEEIKKEDRVVVEEAKTEEVTSTIEETEEMKTETPQEEPKQEEKKNDKKEHKKSFLGKKNDEELKKLEENNKTLQDKVLRITAEMQNMRRRMEEEKVNYLKYEGEELIKQLLPIVDNFERAIKMDDDNLEDEVSKFLSGFKMIYSNLTNILNGYEVKEIECLNMPFDPNTMEAVLVDENSNKEPNIVIDVLQKGYTYKGKVIRHAFVKVSK